jgi:hypothetical protein
VEQRHDDILDKVWIQIRSICQILFE